MNKETSTERDRRIARNVRAMQRRAHHAGVVRLGRAHKCEYCA